MKLRTLAVVAALAALPSSAMARAPARSRDSISASPSQLVDGSNSTVSWSVSSPNVDDYVAVFSNGDYAGNFFYTSSCSESPGTVAKGSGSCTMQTGNGSPGVYQYKLYHSTGTLDVTSGNQTVTADLTIGSCPYPEPTGNVTSGGHTWTLIGSDDFNKSAALGSFATTNQNAVVYTGDQGLKWVTYPDGWPSTYSGTKPGYSPKTVQSVHDGVLDWYLHSDSSGNPVSANPSPLMPNGTQYQTYGRYSFCEKIVPTDTKFLSDFKQAILLWPSVQANGPAAESDYPEGNLNQSYMSAFAHNLFDGQDQFTTDTVSDNGAWNGNTWIEYTQEWGPGYRNYYINGTLIGTSTNDVYSGLERNQLQVEMNGQRTGATGHVYVDWYAVWGF